MSNGNYGPRPKRLITEFADKKPNPETKQKALEFIQFLCNTPEYIKMRDELKAKLEKDIYNFVIHVYYDFYDYRYYIRKQDSGHGFKQSPYRIHLSSFLGDKETNKVELYEWAKDEQ